MSGNAKAVERLRAAYDRGGSCDLEDMNEDVMAVAGLLKLFLRELPDGVVGERLTGQFVKVQQGGYRGILEDGWRVHFRRRWERVLGR